MTEPMNQSCDTKTGGTASPPQILYSSEGSRSVAEQMGAAHYSYRFTEAKFIGLLTKMGFAPRHVEIPPYYGTNSLINMDARGELPRKST